MNYLTTTLNNKTKAAKAVNTAMLLTTLLLGAFLAQPAAAILTPVSINSELYSVSVSNDTVQVRINGGVLTLSGYFSDTNRKQAVLQAAKAHFDVDFIIDLTTVSN